MICILIKVSQTAESRLLVYFQEKSAREETKQNSKSLFYAKCISNKRFLSLFVGRTVGNRGD